MHKIIRRPLLGLIGLVPALASAQTTYDWTSASPLNFSLRDAANWSKTGPAPDGFPNSDSATASLLQDWTAIPTWTLDGNVQANHLIYDDIGSAGDVAGAIEPGTGGTLTLSGGAPNIEVRSSTLTINVPVAGDSLVKTGNSVLALTAANPNLTGSLTVSDVAATNNNGVQFHSLASMGGLTEIIVLGTHNTNSTPPVTTGGHVSIRNSMTVSPAVAWYLSGQGGNSAPQGTIRSLGGNNVIEGPVMLNTGGIRLANNGGAGSSLTFKGPITAGVSSGFAPIFRWGEGLGIEITNPNNYWEGTTVHSQEIFRFAPGSLPDTTGLQMAASGNGHIETYGSLHRALGGGTGQMYFTGSTDAARTCGWSARGGALDLNIGGSGADVKFLDSASKTGTFANSSNQVTVNNTTGLTAGMYLSGTGLAGGTSILDINGNILTISAGTTSAQTNITVTAHRTTNLERINTNSVVLNGSTADSTLTLANPLDLNGFGRTVQSNAAGVRTIAAGGIKNTNAATASLTKVGAGLLEIPGPVDNAINFNANAGQLSFTGAAEHLFNGAVTANGGVVLVRKNSGLGDPAGGVNFGGTTNTGGIIFDGTGSGPLTIPENTFSLSQRRANQPNGATPVPLQSHLRKTGSQPVTLTGNISTNTGGAFAMIETEGAGVFTLSGTISSAATGTRQFRFGGSGEGEITGAITQGSAGALALQKIGSGSWRITKTDHTFPGNIVLTGGELRVERIGSIGDPSSLGAGRTGSSIKFEGGALVYTGPGDITNRRFTIEATGGSLISSGSGPLVFSDTSDLTVTTSTSIGGSWSTNGTVLATNDVGWMKPGMALSAAGLQAGTEVSEINVAGGVATFNLPATANSGTPESVAVTVTAGSADLSRTFTLGGTNTGANTLAGVLVDDAALGGKLGLRKSGAGRWILTAANVHTGPTLVEGGTLQVDGSLSASPVTVGPNGTLGGTGTIQPAAIVQGTLAPGGSVGSLTFGGALTWSGTGTGYHWELASWTGAAGTGFDTVTAATADFSAITSAQPVRIQVQAGASVGAVSETKTFPILRTSGGITGFAANKFAVTVSDPSSSLPTGSWSVQQVANDLVLRFEPGAGSPYDIWAAAQGLTGPNSGFDQDADGDGVPNGVEFVLDGAPLNGGNAPVINAAINGNTLSLSFLRRDDAASLNPILEVSTTMALNQWTPLAEGVNGVTVQITANGAAPDLVVYNVPIDSFPVRFARLRVTR